jgi:hypothetical protein
MGDFAEDGTLRLDTHSLTLTLTVNVAVAVAVDVAVDVDVAVLTNSYFLCFQAECGGR